MFNGNFSPSFGLINIPITININFGSNKKDLTSSCVEVTNSCIEISTDIIDHFFKENGNKFDVCVFNNTDNEIPFSVDSGYICCHNQYFDIMANQCILPAHTKTVVKINFYSSNVRKVCDNNHCELCVSIDGATQSYAFPVKDVAEHSNQLFIKHSIIYYHGVLYGINDLQSFFRKWFISNDVLSIQKIKVIKEYTVCNDSCIEFCLEIQTQKECNTYDIEDYIS